MSEILSAPFIQRAFWGGIIVGFLGSFYGSFIVQRKMSFLSGGIAHSAFGGVALGLLLGIVPLYTAAPFAVAAALAVEWLKGKTKLAPDALIGVLFSLSTALGVIFIYIREDYSADAFSYLFGSILAVTSEDIRAAAALAAITAAISVKYWGRWAYATFDEELAMADKIPVKADNYLLFSLTALTIVISMKIVGILLISAFLIIPPAAARLVSKTFFTATVVSISVGAVCVVGGIAASVAFDMPSGAAIVILESAVFATFMLLKNFGLKVDNKYR